MARGSGIDYEFFYGQEEDRRDSAPTLTSCAFCKWSYNGTAVEGRKRAEAHRLKKHSGIKRTPRRRPPVPSRVKQAKISKEERDEIALERRRRMFILGIDE